MKNIPVLSHALSSSGRISKNSYNSIIGGGASLQPIYESCLMLAMLLSLFCCSSNIRAQNYNYTANSEYGKVAMHQYFVADATQSQYSSTDPNIILTMDCLAA